ncbi:MAG: glycosyltransferase family A protein [Enhygromyxa sp.]
MARTPFSFGIPLIGRAVADDWPLVEALLELTLASVAAQTQQDFQVIVAGHDRPEVLPRDDPRFTFVQAPWPVEAVRSDNLDGGRKKFAISELVRERGGGLLMFLDADDWVDTQLVEATRAVIDERHVVAVIEGGYAVGLRGLEAVQLPHPEVFDGQFHQVCGSSVVLQLWPDDPDSLRRDPYAVLHEHHRCLEVASEHGLEVARVPAVGAYLVDTSVNHSELHGPFARWRREFNEGVRRAGRPVDEAFAARFGLSLAQIRRSCRQNSRD